MNLSVVLATYNEKENIKRCLDSVGKVADEIVVVDGLSTDGTAEIAGKLGARVIITENRPMFHTNKQMAMDEAKGKWVLQLDADEVVSRELAEEINKIIKSDGKYAAYYLKRKNMFLGRWLRKGGQYPDPVIRLYRKGRARLPQKSVHEQMEVDGEVGCLKANLIHNTAPTFSRYLTNANRYTSLTASEFNQQGLSIGFISFIRYMFIKPIATFFSLYFRHKGIIDGYPGFIFALFSGIHWQIAYLKYWEIIFKKEK